MNKLLFLDFDGVLNNRKTMAVRQVCGFHSRIYTNRPFDKSEFNFDESCLENLRRIIAGVPGLKVVISSNWRYGVYVKHFAELFELFDVPLVETQLDMIDNMVGEDTTYKRSFIIAKYVRDYQETHKIKVTFACLDDRADLYHSEYVNEHLVWCNPDFGLTTGKADVVIEKLTKE